MKRKQQLQIRSLLQVLEHVGFCILLFLFLSGQFSFNYSSQTSDNVHQIKIQPKSQQFIANGNSFAIFEREDVHPAPAASMSMDSVEIGDYTQFHDTRGDIYKFKLGKDVMVNMYRTEKGTLESFMQNVGCNWLLDMVGVRMNGRFHAQWRSSQLHLV
eukprot:TRINITY_DN10522_c1_g1_i3.p1 TRINITY_DN10522_c1_g1~~TRINITY_DN10522_c1_g1_i3.p1  ORF type:complete len:172 (-),score=6.06 TRINITY_DN10522_c1_g1_i3:595-1068(-)